MDCSEKQAVDQTGRLRDQGHPRDAAVGRQGCKIRGLMKGGTALLGVVFLMLHSAFAEAVEGRIEDLTTRIEAIHDDVIKRIPKNLRNEIEGVDNPREFNELSGPAQDWLHENVGLSFNNDMKLVAGLNEDEESMTGDDRYQIAQNTFFARLKGRPIELIDELDRVAIYWREHAIPDVWLAPEGQGGIDWIWRLEAKDRPGGVLHVGMDRKSRRFLCYESTVGVYYPEGDVLERIYAEIVQEPDVAGVHLGKGRLARQEREEPEKSK